MNGLNGGEQSQQGVQKWSHKTLMRHRVQVCLASLATLAISSCATHRPCDPQLILGTDPSAPPKECRVDGCSLAPDFDFRRCCDEHDVRYWVGGTAEERKQTDRRFRACIAAADHDVLSNLYYFGVLIGGTPYLPTPWRWGFGWDYPHGYESARQPAAADNSHFPSGATFR